PSGGGSASPRRIRLGFSSKETPAPSSCSVECYRALIGEIVTQTACSCGKHTKRQRVKFHCRRMRSLSHVPMKAKVAQNNVIMHWFVRTQWGFCTAAGERWTLEHCAISVTAANRLDHHRSRRWLNGQVAMAKADHTQSRRARR